MAVIHDQLSHLQALEAESIDIIREVASSFQRPVMMYSIGKDSSVMLHLARKAFAPGEIPFPLLHIDTTWIEIVARIDNELWWRSFLRQVVVPL